MNIRQREENGIVVYTLDGRVDSEGAVQLDAALNASIDAGKHKIALDMSQVQYINSAALRTLAEVITHTREHNGDLKLIALQPKVKRVLQIVGFDKFSSIYDTLDAAIADF